MPESLLTVLKLVFLALLYLFFVRVIRAVWTELQDPKTIQVAVAPPGGGPRPPVAAGRQRSTARIAAERLVVREPPDRFGQMFELGDELTVGRASGCGVALPDDTFVSQLHARVFRRDGALYVEDLGSTNGTLLNQRPVTSAVALRKGDRLQVGQTVLELDR